MIEGPPGIGKSRLLEETCAIARRKQVRVASGHAFWAQPAVPFAPLFSALFEGQPPLYEVDVLRHLSSRPDQRYWLVQEIEALLERSALEQPLAIMIDDIHWADPATLFALRTLSVGLAGLPIVWLLTMRAGERAGELQATIAMLERSGGQRLRLQALPRKVVTSIAADVLGADPAPGLLELAERAHGNPFLLVELLEGLREDGMVEVERGRVELLTDGLPGRLRDSMDQRLERLDDEARRLVLVASVLGRRFSVELLATMLDRQPTALLAPLEEAVRAEFLSDEDGQLTFRHDLLHEGVLSTLAEPVRRGLQRQAAAVLEASGAGPVAVAAQLAASAEVGDRAAVAKLREAARALSGSDAGGAADLGVRALELILPDDPVRGEVVAETVILLYAALRGEEATALASDVLSGKLPPEQEAEVRLSLGGINLRSADARAADNRCALALTGLSPRVRARHHAALTFNLMTAGRFKEADRLIDSALTSARECGDRAALGTATFTLASLEATRGRFTRALEVLEESRHHLLVAGRATDARALDVTRARMLADVGRREDALTLSAEGVASAERDGHAWLLRLWLVWRSQLLFEAGELSDARVEAEAAQSMAEGAVEALPDAIVTLVLGRIALHTGDTALLDVSLRRASELQHHETPKVRRFSAWLLTLAAAASGDHTDAVSRLVDDELPYAVPLAPAEITHPPVVVRIALGARARDLALRAVRVAELYERENPTSALLRAGAAHARGLLADDVDELVRAVELYRDCDRPLLLATAGEDAALALAHASRTEEAITMTRVSLDVWAAVGAIAEVRRLGRHLRHFGVRPTPRPRTRPLQGWASLTDSELRIVRLVARGHTNREVAERVFLSPHTVSSHLRHAFEKLKIHSRVELTRLVLEREPQRVSAPLRG